MKTYTGKIGIVPNQMKISIESIKILPFMQQNQGSLQVEEDVFHVSRRPSRCHKITRDIYNIIKDWQGINSNLI